MGWNAPRDPTTGPESSPTITVLTDLRVYLAENLGLDRRLVGGWEVIAERDATLAVYSNGGDIERGSGGQVTRQDEEVSVVFMVRTGSPIAEQMLYPVRDAIGELLVRFTHPLLAGVGKLSWVFDIKKDGAFVNVLTVKTTLKHRSAPVAMRTPDTSTLGRAKAVIAHLHHIGIKEQP